MLMVVHEATLAAEQGTFRSHCMRGCIAVAPADVALQVADPVHEKHPDGAFKHKHWQPHERQHQSIRPPCMAARVLEPI